jgi:putative transposase
VIVGFIDEHRDEFGVEPICTTLQVAPSTYYAAKRRELAPSARAVRDALMMQVLMVLWVANRKVYGAHKLWKAARRAGHDVGRDQVARLMSVMEIEGISRQRRKVFTTRQDPDAVRAPDLVNRNFRADRPDALWVTDLTYVPTRTGMAYVCFIVDAFSRRIVGWRVAANMKTDMVLDALEMARRSRGNRRLIGLVTHSDAGSQGGINWSSQHLEMEVDDGPTAWVVGDVDGEAVDAFAGSTADASRCGAGVLDQDRQRSDERGRCGGVRRVRSSRHSLVPRGWRHADHRVEPANGPVSVVR